MPLHCAAKRTPADNKQSIRQLRQQCHTTHGPVLSCFLAWQAHKHDKVGAVASCSQHTTPVCSAVHGAVVVRVGAALVCLPRPEPHDWCLHKQHPWL